MGPGRVGELPGGGLRLALVQELLRLVGFHGQCSARILDGLVEHPPCFLQIIIRQFHIICRDHTLISSDFHFGRSLTLITKIYDHSEKVITVVTNDK